MLEVQIYKKLAEFDLDVSFQVNDNILGLMGASGSGKSMTLKCIAGIEMPDQGRIVLNGRVLFDSEKKINVPIQKRNVGYMFQSYALFPNMNVYENISVGLRARIVKDVDIVAQKVMKQFQISELASRYPKQLSGGQKQRVAIARALSNNPKVLLSDEATSALDPDATESILKLLRDLNKRLGITIILITHEMSVVQEICNRVAVLESGTLVESGTVEELFRSPKTEAARRLVFSGRTQIQEMNGKRLVRVTFRDKSSFEPVIANLVLTYRTPVNILYADTKNIGGAAEGEMILQLPEIEEVADKMIQYLKDTNMGVEELKSDVG